MRWWTVVYPEENNKQGYEIVSEAHIRETYFPYWKEKMDKVDPGINWKEGTLENCIQDWVTVHWAEPFNMDRFWDYYERCKFQDLIIRINGKLLSCRHGGIDNVCSTTT